MQQTKSQELFEKARQFFPGGVNSPVRAFRSVGGTPLFMKKGKGAYIWDADDNKYLDFCCSWGPLILGHANDVVLNKVQEVMQNGTSFGAPTELENELAELILSNHRYIDKMRFVSSGTEAVMSAIRLARGFTGKNKILKFEGCYHGHSDSLLVKAGSGLVTFGNSSSAGVPESIVNETLVLPLNSEAAIDEAFQKYGNEIACVILEPVPANNGLLLQRKEFLQHLRNVCTKYNSVLLFDEVISGFRIGFEGAASHYQIQPDLMTFGKIIGGGFPVGAYAGKKEIMACISPEGNVYQAGTLSGNPVAMAAGIAQLQNCLQKDFYLNLENKAKKLVDGLNALRVKMKIPFHVHRIGSIFWIAFSDEAAIRSAESIDGDSMKYFKTLYHNLLKKGIYFGPSGYEVGFVSSAHSDQDIQFAIDTIGAELIQLDKQ